MRLVVQRVSEAVVTVDGETVGAIGSGLAVLVGVTHDDDERDAHVLAEKLSGLRVFNDVEGKMNLGIGDVGGSVLVVSQFTLYGNARRGRRPSFSAASEPAHAEKIIDHFCERLRGTGVDVATGKFRAAMQVALINDGPVTLILETADGQLV